MYLKRQQNTKSTNTKRKYKMNFKIHPKKWDNLGINVKKNSF